MAASSCTSAPSGAAPDMIILTDEKSYWSTIGDLASAITIGQTFGVVVAAVDRDTAAARYFREVP